MRITMGALVRSQELSTIGSKSDFFIRIGANPDNPLCAPVAVVPMIFAFSRKPTLALQ